MDFSPEFPGGNLSHGHSVCECQPSLPCRCGVSTVSLQWTGFGCGAGMTMCFPLSDGILTYLLYSLLPYILHWRITRQLREPISGSAGQARGPVLILVNGGEYMAVCSTGQPRGLRYSGALPEGAGGAACRRNKLQCQHMREKEEWGWDITAAAHNPQ
jgi:hypothetical protein